LLDLSGDRAADSFLDSRSASPIGKDQCEKFAGFLTLTRLQELQRMPPACRSMRTGAALTEVKVSFISVGE